MDKQPITLFQWIILLEKKIEEIISRYNATRGIPSGGAAGQYLRKTSATDYDVEWASGGGGSGDVTAAGDNTFTGSNTFQKPVKVSTPVEDGDAATKVYVDDVRQTLNDDIDELGNGLNDLDSEAVKKTGDQTIAGVKTFSSSPQVPEPTKNTDAATKKYVDDHSGGGGVIPTRKKIYSPTSTPSVITDIGDVYITSDGRMLVDFEFPAVKPGHGGGSLNISVTSPAIKPTGVANGVYEACITTFLYFFESGSRSAIRAIYYDIIYTVTDGGATMQNMTYVVDINSSSASQIAKQKKRVTADAPYNYSAQPAAFAATLPEQTEIIVTTEPISISTEFGEYIVRNAQKI